MDVTLLKSKIHRAKVTGANLYYEGSVSIDRRLCEAAHIHKYEKVEIYNCDNGARLSTYVIEGEPGEVGLNGAAARHVHPGDSVIICSYGQCSVEEALTHKPIVLLVDNNNEIHSKK